MEKQQYSFECDQQIIEREAEPVIPPRIEEVVRYESEKHPIAARNKLGS